eukprot:gene21952-26909_t
MNNPQSTSRQGLPLRIPTSTRHETRIQRQQTAPAQQALRGVRTRHDLAQSLG